MFGCRTIFSLFPSLTQYVLVAFLLAYLKQFHTWFTVNDDKKWTFIFPLLNIYQQFGK